MVESNQNPRGVYDMHYENYVIEDEIQHLVGLAHHRRFHRPTRAYLRVAEAQLRASGYLDGVSAHDLRRLAEHACQFSYPAHWTVIAEGTVPDRCLMLMEGTVSYRHRGEVIGSAGSGMILGLDDAAAHRAARSTIVSEEPLTGIAVETAMLLDVLNTPAPHRSDVPAFGGVPIPSVS